MYAAVTTATTKKNAEAYFAGQYKTVPSSDMQLA